MSETTKAEWEAEGLRRFGGDQMKWRFVCPSCGNTFAVEDWMKANAPESAIAFSCPGRWSGGVATLMEKDNGPCNYAGGGLFTMNPVTITDTGHSVFAFAEP